MPVNENYLKTDRWDFHDVWRRQQSHNTCAHIWCAHQFGAMDQAAVPGWTCGQAIIYRSAMIKAKFIDDLARQISSNLPSGVKLLQEDVEKNIRSLLQGTFARLDLVTRSRRPSGLRKTNW